jgi:uncharacterized BrkB/YihY/UPF0761 family membrane protein
MVVLKSFFAGLAVTLITAIGAAFVFVIILGIASRDLPEGQAIGWDPISLLRHSLISWVILGSAFVLGFFWEYRRAVAEVRTRRKI